MNFLLNLYIPLAMVAQKFQIYSVKITGKHIFQWKYFTHAPKQNSPPRFYLYALGRRNSVSEDFFSSVEREKEERIMELKKLPNLNLGGY